MYNHNITDTVFVDNVCDSCTYTLGQHISPGTYQDFITCIIYIYTYLSRVCLFIGADENLHS